MANILDRVGQQLAAPATQPAQQAPTGNILERVATQMSQPTQGGQLARVGSALAQATPAAPAAEPTMLQKFGAGIKEAFTNPGQFLGDVAPAVLGDKAGAAFNQGAAAYATGQFAGEIPGIVASEGIDTAKEAAMAIPRAAGQTLGSGTSYLYRSIGAVADVLGLDATPYIAAADQQTKYFDKVESNLGPTAAAQNNPLGLASITRQVGPSVAQSATAFINPASALGVIAATVAGSASNDFDAMLKQQYPQMSDADRNQMATALGGVDAAAQTALERFNPFQKLARGIGPKNAQTLIRKMAWAYGTGATNEALQQVPEELIKLGIDPREAQFQEGLKSVFENGFYGGFGGATAPIIDAGIGKREAPTRPSNPAQPATAADLSAADALVEPTLPPALARRTFKDRQTQQPLTFENDYAKAKYVVDSPAFRGPNKEAAQAYVTAFDRYQEAKNATNQPVSQPTPDVAAPTVPTQPVANNAAATVAGPTQQLANAPAAQQNGSPTAQAEPVSRNAAIQLMAQTHKDSTFDKAPLNSTQARAKKVMKAKGLEVVYYDTTGTHAGITSPQTPGYLFVDRNRPIETMHEALLHEFGHNVQNTMPDVWNALGLNETNRENQALAFGQLISDARVKAKIDPTVWNKIKALYTTFKEKFTGRESNPLIDKVVKLLDEQFEADVNVSDEFTTDTMQVRPNTSYGYWLTKDGRFLPVGNQDHHNVAKDNFGKDIFESLKDGNVRIVDEGGLSSIEAATPADLNTPAMRAYVKDILSQGRDLIISTTENGGGGIQLYGSSPKLSTQALKFNAFIEGRLKETDFFTPSKAQPKPTVREKAQEAVAGDTLTTPHTIIRQAKETRKGEQASAVVEARAVNQEFDEATRDHFGKGFDALSDVERTGLLAALRGSTLPLAGYSPDLRVAISKMRDMIDKNSDKIIAQLRAHHTPADRRLARLMAGNKGSYANLSYSLFDQPEKWINAVMGGKGRFAQIKADYLSWLDSRLKLARVTLTKDELEAEGLEVLRDIAGNKLASGAAAGQGLSISPSGRKPVGILKRRQKLPPELRAALGENVNAPLVFEMTVAKQAGLIAAHNFQKKVLTLGMDKWLFKTKPNAEFSYPIDVGDNRNPLHGYYTTKEIAKEFELQKQDIPNTIVGAIWRKANAISRQAVTVGSSAALGANVLGQWGFLIGSGIVNPMSYAKALIPSRLQMKTILTEYPAVARYLATVTGDATKLTAAQKDASARYTKLGLTNDSVFAQDALEALREVGLNPNEVFDDGAVRKAFGKLAIPVKVAQAIYNLNDTRTKLLIFEDTVAALTKAFPSKTAQEIDEMAADRTLNSYPSYQRAYKWAKTLSRSGIVGPFAPYMAEVFRTTHNNIAYAMKDLNDGYARAKAGEKGGWAQVQYGLRRTGGMAVLLGVLPAIAQVLSHSLGGLGDDEEDKLREQLPPWLRNTTGFFIKNGEGKYQYINLSRYVPVLSIADSIKAFSDGIPAGASTMASPFISEQLVTGRALDIRGSINGDGKVFNPEDSADDKVVKSVKYLLTPMLPDVVTRPFTKIIPAFRGATDNSGRELDPEDQLLRMFGVTVQTVDMADNIEFASGNHNRRVRNANTLFTDALRQLGKTGETDVFDAYTKMEDARLRIWQDTYDAINAARNSGLTDAAIQQKLRMGGAKPNESTGMTAQDIGAIMKGQYRPYDFIQNPKYQSKYAEFPTKIAQGKLIDERNRRQRQTLSK